MASASPIPPPPDPNADGPVTAIIITDDPFTDVGHTSVAKGHSYSLLLLFYLTTLSAILAATCRLAFTGSLWTFSAFAKGWLGFGLLGLFFGIVAAFATAPGAKSISLGLLSAVIMGLIASFMTLIEPTHFQSLALIVPAGCLLLVFIALIATR